MKMKSKSQSKTKELRFQREILGMLVAEPNRQETGVDLARVISFTLVPVPVPLSTVSNYTMLPCLI